MATSTKRKAEPEIKWEVRAVTWKVGKYDVRIERAGPTSDVDVGAVVWVIMPRKGLIAWGGTVATWAEAEAAVRSELAVLAPRAKPKVTTQSWLRRSGIGIIDYGYALDGAKTAYCRVTRASGWFSITGHRTLTEAKAVAERIPWGFVIGPTRLVAIRRKKG